MKKIFGIIILFVFFNCGYCFSQEKAYTSSKEKIYKDANFIYEFQIRNKESNIKPKKEVSYFWYKSKTIHSSFFDYSGKLLHGDYVKLEKNTSQLLEKGTFKKGIKIGVWKTWYTTGVLKTNESWKDGFKHGTYEEYNKKGLLVQRGNYKKGLKKGRWKYPIQKKEVRYKNDIIITAKKRSFWRKIIPK